MKYKVDLNEAIGFKKLTSADLFRDTADHFSNQTHIGLLEGTLTYLHNKEDVLACLYIDGAIVHVPTLYGMIENQDGSFRSPKIRKGNDQSVVQAIRDYALKDGINSRWYLIWGSLCDEQPFFILFSDRSHIFQDLLDYNLYDPGCFDYNKKERAKLIPGEPIHFALSKYINHLLNDVTSEDEKLEFAVLAGVFDPGQYRPRDISKARKKADETGRKGELLIDAYLARLADNGEIVTYCWMNREEESYAPFDFKITNNNGEIIYVDVKTTGYKFDNPVIFSSKEAEFITKCPSYQIYRVFENNDRYYLRVCSNASDHFTDVHRMIEAFKKSSKELMDICELSISITPSVHTDVVFEEEIDLDLPANVINRINKESNYSDDNDQ